MMVGRLTTILTVMSLSSVGAVTIHVPQDQPTIQAGIDAAVTGDTVLVDDGVYTGEGNRDMDFNGKNIVLVSRGGPEATVIDCQQAGRAFYFHSGEDSTARIEGFTITNGAVGQDNSGGAVLCEYSSPTITNCIFLNNFALTVFTGHIYGGAVCAIGSSLRISRCLFQGNNCWVGIPDYEAWGGAFAGLQGTPTLDSCVFIGNLSGRGGAVFAGDGADLSLKNCTFVANHSRTSGSVLALGSYYFSGAVSATVDNCILAFNEYGYLVRFHNDSANVNFACTNIFGNVGGDWVGEIADQIGINGNLSANPLFCAVGDDNFFLSNYSPCAPENNSCNEQIGAFPVGCYSTYRIWHIDSDGGGEAPSIQAALDSSTHGDTILLSDGVYSGVGNYDLNFKGKNLVLKSENGAESTIIDCDSLGRGLYFGGAEDSTAVVEDVTITKGLEEFGGGIYCGALTSPTIRRCRFEQNSTSYRGGAASVAANASPMFVDCAFVENRSPDKGGAVFTEISASPTFYACRFEANHAEQGGAAYFSGTSLIDACIFHSNTATVGGGAIGVYGSVDLVTLQNCTVTHNSAPLGGGVYLFYGSVSLVNTLICFNTEGEAVYKTGHGSAAATTCSNVFGNAGGDWVGALEGQQDQNGNFSENPYFCDTTSGDLHVLPWSPCVPDNNSCGLLMGALSTGCQCVIRGDINHDGNQTVDISDLVYLVDYMFAGGPVPPSMEEADINGDGNPVADISDLVFLVDFMFNGGAAPVVCL